MEMDEDHWGRPEYNSMRLQANLEIFYKKKKDEDVS